jgi:ATP-dependent helicase/nuclease subunit B
MRTNVFSISPGAPFLKTFAEALLAGQIIAGFSRALGPLEIADATIYVPTRRAARALANELSRALDRPATLLPRLLPLGALDATETSLFFEESSLDPILDPDLPLAANEILRRMLLSDLVLQWGEVLRHAIIAIDADGKRRVDPGEACLVGTSPIDAWHLASELAGLIDELIIEDVEWKRLDPLVLPEFDIYWRITIDFLDIAIRQWPDILRGLGLADPAYRRMKLVDTQSKRILSGQAGPVIAIGSTGTNRATARLLAAIARAPQGAVVLPGLDTHLDTTAWTLISAGVSEGTEPSFGHPQAALARLLPVLNIKREDVTLLGDLSPALTTRGHFISEALRPADTTDLWRFFLEDITTADLAQALEGVTLIEAADEREEALCIAIALREVLTHPNKTAALVTPDRELARRVKAELSRWNIEVDDSAGEVLSASPHGRLARLIASCGQNHLDRLALLQHPLARLGMERTDVESLWPLYEIGIARAEITGHDINDPINMIAAAQAALRERFSHPAQKRITSHEWALLEKLLKTLAEILAPLQSLRGRFGLPAWIAAHRQVFAAITRAENGSSGGEDRETLEHLFDELSAHASHRMMFDAEAYADFFMRVAQETPLRGPVRAHPRLKIFGLLEARLMQADVMLLGGLDETIWPPQAQSDAFLNRPMRSELGLTPPERKIGQTAHDFTQAMGCERVILSRAAKRGGTPMVASRFLQRLAALGGGTWDTCITRGDAILSLARAIDRPPTAPKPIKRPTPKPPLDLRPTRLSVTRIEMLRRDPYAIFAEYCLGLAELAPISQKIEYRAIGTAMHEALARFTNLYPSGSLPLDADAIMTALIRELCADYLQDPQFAAFRWRRIKQEIAFLLSVEAKRRQTISHIDVEIKGTLDIFLADQSVFTLSATADRIEHLTDGRVAILDYKTGTAPSLKEIGVGFAPQLTLEAAMAERGAFGVPARVKEAIYLKLGGAKSYERPLIFNKGETSLEEIVQKHYDDLIGLLNQFRDETCPYTARPFPQFAARYNAYDHLSRVKEWSIGNLEDDSAS